MLDRPHAPRREVFLPLTGYATILAFFLFSYWKMGGTAARVNMVSFSLGPPKGARAFQMFLEGITRHEGGLDPREACHDGNASDDLFCEEGYYFSRYSHFLLEATWKQKDPRNPIPIEIADADAPIKAVALGMAAAQKSILPRGIRLRDDGYEKYFFDGYGAGRQLDLGRSENNVENICGGLRYRKYCEFGAGRACYFLGTTLAKANDSPDYRMGREFAAVATGDVVPLHPTAIQRIALAWRNYGNVGEAKNFYACATTRGRHIVDCLALMGDRHPRRPKATLTP